MTTVPQDATRAAGLDELDLFDDAVLADRDPHFTRLRETAAAVHLPASGLWAITRYRPIRQALGDPGTFSSAGATFNAFMNRALRGSSLASDPPEHRPLRAVLARNLSPRTIRAHLPLMEELAERLVGQAVKSGSCDAVTGIVNPFHEHVIADLIGMPPHIRERVVPWGEAALNVFGPFNQRTIQHFPTAGQIVHWAMNVGPEDLAEGSIGRGVFEAADRGEIPRRACGGIIHQYVAAGIDTAIASLGNLLLLLAAHPEQYAELRAEPSLIPAAYTESLRYSSPLHAMGRLTTRDVDVDGTTIPAGAQVALLFGAGNRDPRHYPDPDSFHIRRNPVDHLSFGHGPHSCAGTTLIQAEAHALLRAMTTSVASLAAGPAVPKISNLVHGYASLPLTFEPT